MDLSELKKDTVSGVMWSFISRFSQMLVQFVVTIILSRLLIPDDFATIGILTVFILLCNIIVESGFGQALIRKFDVSQTDYSSVFFFNLLLSIVIYVVLFLLSDIIASYFHNEVLSPASKIVFITIILNALTVVPNAILSRNLSYKKIAIVNLVAVFISAICGIATALLNWGVFALVAQMITFSLTSTILFILVTKWRPSRCFSFMSIKQMLRFSMSLLGTGIIITLFNNLITLLIGRFYSKTELGYYTQAKKLEDVPSQSITSIIQGVSYSAIAKVQRDDSLIKIAYKKVLFQNVYVVFPIMMFCLISADYLIPFLYGEQWFKSIPLFKILCIYGALFPLFSVNINILKVKGLGGKVLQVEVVRRVLMVLFILFALHKGIPALLWSWVISMVISVLYSFGVCGKPIQYSIITQLIDILPYILIALLPIPFVLGLNYLYTNPSYFIQVSIDIVLYFALYWFVSHMFRIQAYVELKNIIQSFSIKQILNSK